MGLDALVGSGQQVAVGVAHLDQADGAALIGLLRLAARSGQFSDLAIQGVGADLLLGHIRQGVLNLFARLQNGGAIGR